LTATPHDYVGIELQVLVALGLAMCNFQNQVFPTVDSEIEAKRLLPCITAALKRNPVLLYCDPSFKS
jgi:hypothetical protein